ncbi:MAG: glycosyltransferase family 2 protein, partial [Crocinitomicaceae bacterium]
MSTISIITPFKDAAPFLKDCIDSICRQSHDSWQLIAIDDHSEDHSRAIIESYKDPRIEIYTNKGKGILCALQTAQDHIKGNYVTRMDADDIMPDDKLKVLLEVLYASTSKTIATGLAKYFSGGEVSEGYRNYESWLNDTAQQGLFYERIYRECVVASPNWLMHRMDFDLIGG